MARFDGSPLLCERDGCMYSAVAVATLVGDVLNLCAGCLRLVYVKRELRALFHFTDPDWLGKQRRLPPPRALPTLGPGPVRARAR